MQVGSGSGCINPVECRLTGQSAVLAPFFERLLLAYCLLTAYCLLHILPILLTYIRYASECLLAYCMHACNL